MATYCQGTKDGRPCSVNESTLSADGYLDGSCDHCWWINEKAAGRVPSHWHCDCSTCNGSRFNGDGSLARPNKDVRADLNII